MNPVRNGGLLLTEKFGHQVYVTAGVDEVLKDITPWADVWINVIATANRGFHSLL